MTDSDRSRGEDRGSGGPGGADRKKPTKFSFGWVILLLLAVLLASQFFAVLKGRFPRAF